MVALQARSSNSGPRELFSISQIEKAFGAAYMPPGSEGCVRAWGERYLTGLKEPELTYEQALALPQGTNEEKRERSSYIAKTFGKALEAKADEWFETGTVSFSDEPGKRLFPGLHLLPHPSQLDVLPDGRRGYHKQVPVSVKLLSFNSPEAISFQGFKDAIFRVNGARFLVDYKTTKPKVDNRKNAELGKPAGWWTWMKTPEQLLGDYQWNLYQWDEYSKHEHFLPSRWVYFASQETPQARAVDIQLAQIDPDRVRSICTQLADRANVLRGYIRGWRASRERASHERFVSELPKNVAYCNAFGRLCPYHVRSPGGTCTGGDDQVVPVGLLLSAPNSRPIKSVEIPVFDPNSHSYTFHSTEGAQEMNAPSIKETIQQQLAQQQGAAPGPQFSAPPPGYGPPPGPPAQFAPQGAPPQAPAPQAFPSGYQGQPFAPGPAQPGYQAPAPAAQPAPHVGAPEYQPSNVPPQPIAQQVYQQQAAANGPFPAGTPAQGYPGFFHDGQGGFFQGAPQAPPPVQTGPVPAVAQASAPEPAATPAINVQDLYNTTGTVERDGVVLSVPLSGELAALVLAFVLEQVLSQGDALGVSAEASSGKKRGRPKKSA